MSRDLINRLGTFLADLTQDRPPAKIHADLLSGINDAQVAEVYEDERDFVTVWSALRHGAALPEASWARLVLPTVVYFSPAGFRKANLASALHLWQEARSNTPAEITALPIIPVYEPAVADLPQPEPVAPPPDRPRERRLLLVVVLTISAACLASVVAVMINPGLLREGGITPLTSPSPTSPVTSASPSAFASATPSASAPARLPSAPTTQTVAGVVIVAPANVRISNLGRRNATIAWDPAPNAVSYQVRNGGSAAGQTGSTSFVAENLSPATTYTFAVIAIGASGATSAPSQPITTTTIGWPTPAFAVSPNATVPLGQSFAITGTGTPCDSPGQLRLSLDDRLIAIAQSDPDRVTLPVYVVQDGGDWVINVIGSGYQIVLSQGDFTFTVSLVPQADCGPMQDQFAVVTFS